jgi:hypothetical protein
VIPENKAADAVVSTAARDVHRVIGDQHVLRAYEYFEPVPQEPTASNVDLVRWLKLNLDKDLSMGFADCEGGAYKLNVPGNSCLKELIVLDVQDRYVALVKDDEIQQKMAVPEYEANQRNAVDAQRDHCCAVSTVLAGEGVAADGDLGLLA